ncbi:uncharacterized protein LOC124925616 [Impatiens glandulifera]|uniref:uncharacterized protein LOC124925616 n=1 Tax=Impatiens glandulifera TaxID=253017 RepID=UPI001FB14836|nr:uncharacterized protein LOC124925616 [Impatiens glandulifera]
MFTNICRKIFYQSLRKSKPTNSFRFHISFSSSASSSSPQPISRVAAAEYLNLHHNFSSEVASKLSSICGSINPEKCDSVISILKKTGFSQTDMERLVSGIPRILSANPHKTVEPKIKTFINSGFSTAETVDLLVIDPRILCRSNDYISTTLAKLNEILKSHSRVYNFLKLGRFPSTCLDKHMIPNIKLLEDLGINSEQLRRYLSQTPRNFYFRTERLMELVNKADELGIRRSCNMLLPTIRILSSMSKGRLERKLNLLKGLGFGEDEISEMIKRTPLVLSVSEEKMEKVTKYLLSSGEAEISTIVGYPLLLMFSFEKRVKHRLQVLKELRSKDLVNGKVNLLTVCKLSDSKFLNKYVVPYSDK